MHVHVQGAAVGSAATGFKVVPRQCRSIWMDGCGRRVQVKPAAVPAPERPQVTAQLPEP